MKKLKSRVFPGWDFSDYRHISNKEQLYIHVEKTLGEMVRNAQNMNFAPPFTFTVMLDRDSTLLKIKATFTKTYEEVKE